MKRFHVHVAVADLDQAVCHYAALFGSEPTVRKADYAKWMLDDPRVNFAVSCRGHAPGVHHLGIQGEDEAELAELNDRMAATRSAVLPEGRTTCCYARSDKAWSTDPAGVLWETFLTLGDTTVYGDGLFAGAASPAPVAASCCGGGEEGGGEGCC
ncbi:ArsI/CadI family heavy metal resistance metalloenzyme [Azospirillum sp. A39]|uniref:ArsI/CadI family heavy metal resistance metalloenzyme n=1 Tax=Azospirillum sp. A39 TaxID=3462279 RepID=UPI0040458760